MSAQERLAEVLLGDWHPSCRRQENLSDREFGIPAPFLRNPFYNSFDSLAKLKKLPYMR